MRLKSLQLPATSIVDEGSFEEDSGSVNIPDLIAGAATKPHNSLHTVGGAPLVSLCTTQEGESSNPHEHSMQSPTQEKSFNLVLASTRVYSRVENGEVDAMSSIMTTRSRAWSILSGLRLAEISIISVIKLPLDYSELVSFRRLAS
ncbi:hypothetical protein N431DRAFT_420992, partial [Stipitochalara longipes BDJ]